MADHRVTRRDRSFVEHWVRSGKANYTANLIAILGVLAVGSVFAIIGGRSLVLVPAFPLASIAALPYHARREERMRRNKEILDRYSPERNPRPLGL